MKIELAQLAYNSSQNAKHSCNDCKKSNYFKQNKRKQKFKSATMTKKLKI